ncbi:MAG: hypothetical protein K6F57_02835 [Candidatus Saccharibacteria bacterium]|nr:hypothetical protein [Candidatus Saccharibacteria bacterium]
MDKGGSYGDYIGQGVDEEQSAQDAMGVEVGNGLKYTIRKAEDSPKKPFDKGKATGEEGGLLSAGEQNQQSDKDESQQGAWVNKTGNRAATVALGAATGGLQTFNSVRKLSAKTGVKVAGPITTIVIVLAVCIGAVLGGVGTMMPALVGNLQSKLDTLDIAAATRSRQIVTSIMLGKNTKGGPWSKFSDHMKKMFSKAGAEVDSGADGNDVLKFTNANGDIETVTGDNFNSKYDTDSNFHTVASDGMSSYNTSTTMHHDAMSVKAEASLGIKSKNTNGDIEESDDPDKMKENFDEDAKAELDDATPQRMSADVEGGNKTEQEVDDGRGGKTTETDVETGKSSIDIDANSDVEAEVTKMVKAEASSGMDFSAVGQVANGMCQLYTTAMTINRMIRAYEAAQVVIMGMKIFEAIQRMQAGDGGADTILNVVANYASRKKTTIFELEKGQFTEVTTSLLGSTPVAAFFGGTKLTNEDTVVKSFVTSPNQFRKIADSLDPSSGYKTCAATKAAAGLIDAAGDAATLGTKKLLDILVGFALGATISVVISAVVSIMVPKIVNALKRDFSNFLEGAEGGGVVAWTAEMVLKEEEKVTGFNVATEQSHNTYIKYRNDVIADRARYDRDNLSPFDTSSEYTFMGTLMRNLMTASVSANNVIGNLGRITSVVNKSLLALTPASHAGDAIDEIVTVGDYPEINSLVDDGQKRIATAFGEPYYVPDFTTAGENIEDVMWYWDAKGAFEEPYDPVNNPNPRVKMDGTGVASVKNPIILAIKEGKTRNSDAMLANYSDGGNLEDEFVLATAGSNDQNELSLCIEEKIGRGAELGQPDAAIEQKYSTGSTGSSFWDAVIGAIPIVGGIIDTVTNLDNLAHLGNILGFKYHADTKVNHMCERYALDQRLGEAMGVYDKAQIADYLDRYYEKHPLDNSITGIVARSSGLTKDQVETALAQAKAFLFVVGYDPTGLGPLQLVEPESKITFETKDDYQYIIGVVYYSTSAEVKRSQNITA